MMIPPKTLAGTALALALCASLSTAQRGDAAFGEAGPDATSYAGGGAIGFGYLLDRELEWAIHSPLAPKVVQLRRIPNSQDAVDDLMSFAGAGQGSGLAPTDIRSVAFGKDSSNWGHAIVSHNGPMGPLTSVFRRVSDVDWSHLGFFGGPAPLGAQVEVEGKYVYIAHDVGVTQVFAFDLDSHTIVASIAVPGNLVALGAGAGKNPGDPNVIMLTTTSGGTRLVRSLVHAGSTISTAGPPSQQAESTGWGDDLDVDEGIAAVGQPFFGAGYEGRIFMYDVASDGSLSAHGEVMSDEALDYWGQQVEVDGDLIAFSELQADVVIGAQLFAGAVRFMRPDPSTGDYVLTGEAIHRTNPYLGSGFGQSLSLTADGTRLAVGSPGAPIPGGSDGQYAWRSVEPVSVFRTNAFPSVPGALGPVEGSLEGSTRTNAPYVLRLRNAAPGGIGFLVLGATQLDVPFKGGVLFPSPDLIVPLLVDPTGAWELKTTWPDLTGFDYSVYQQIWIQDNAAPVGLSSTVGLEAFHDTSVP